MVGWAEFSSVETSLDDLRKLLLDRVVAKGDDV